MTKRGNNGKLKMENKFNKGAYEIERIYECLNENDLGYRVYIGSDKSVYMSYEDAIEYLEGKEVEVDYIEPDNSAIELIVDDKEVSMIAI